MAGLTLTNFDDILKIDYLPPIRDAVNQDTALFNYLEDGNEFISGRHAYIPLHVSRNEGVGARGEGGTLPTAGNQGYNSATYGMRYVYGRVKVTGPAMAGTRDDDGAFAKALDSEIVGITKDLRNDMQRMCWGWGDGLLANSDAATSGTTVFQVDTTLAGYNKRHLRKGMLVDILQVTGTTNVDGTAGGNGIGRKIVSVDSSTGDITLDANFTTTLTTDIGMYRTGTRNIEPMGIGGIFSDVNPDERISSSTLTSVADFGGIDRSVAGNEFWQAQVLSNGGTNRALTIDLLQEAEDTLEQESNGELACWFTTYAIRRKYGNLLVADRRFPQATGKPRDYDGGYMPSDLSFNGKPVKVDKYAHANRVYGIPEGALYNFMWTDFTWMDQDGAILSRSTDEDAYEGTLKSYREMGASNANETLVIEDVSQ